MSTKKMARKDSYSHGERVFARLLPYPFWPATVIDHNKAPISAESKDEHGVINVLFFGEFTYATLRHADIVLFSENIEIFKPKSTKECLKSIAEAIEFPQKGVDMNVKFVEQERRKRTSKKRKAPEPDTETEEETPKRAAPRVEPPKPDLQSPSLVHLPRYAFQTLPSMLPLPPVHIAPPQMSRHLELNATNLPSTTNILCPKPAAINPQTDHLMSEGPLSAHSESVVPKSVNPESAAPHSVNSVYLGPNSVTPVSVSTNSVQPVSLDPKPVNSEFSTTKSGNHIYFGSNSVNSGFVGSKLMNPESVVPQSAHPVSMGPKSIHPAPVGPQLMHPVSLVPQSVQSVTMGNLLIPPQVIQSPLVVKQSNQTSNVTTPAVQSSLAGLVNPFAHVPPVPSEQVIPLPVTPIDSPSTENLPELIPPPQQEPGTQYPSHILNAAHRALPRDGNGKLLPTDLPTFLRNCRCTLQLHFLHDKKNDHPPLVESPKAVKWDVIQDVMDTLIRYLRSPKAEKAPLEIHHLPLLFRKILKAKFSEEVEEFLIQYKIRSRTEEICNFMTVLK